MLVSTWEMERKDVQEFVALQRLLHRLLDLALLQLDLEQQNGCGEGLQHSNVIAIV